MTNLNVLLVDDNAPLRECLEHQLLLENARVVTASDGEEAVERLRQQTAPFDLVLSDVEMPRMDGWHLLDWVHAHDARLPVVLMSAAEPREFIRLAKEVGACGALTKPLALGWLHQLLDRISNFAVVPCPANFYCPSAS